MKKLFLLLVAIVSVAMCASSQTRTIKGTVLDAANDEPLVGATVLPLPAGGVSAVITDIDGHFTLRIPASVKEVKVSYVGYESVTLPVSQDMTVRLKSLDNKLDEVVVTGYGSAKKLGSVVGSVSVVSDQAFEDSPSSNFVDALQGKVAGLAIFSNTGEPSSVPSNIRIRGFNSLDASNTPLFILDGAPTTSSVFTTLNNNDIESVTVLKDASSTAIYGSRAANGVIVITTKKGKYGQAPRVTMRANVGWSQRADIGIKMMNSQEYIKWRSMLNGPVDYSVNPEIVSLVDKYGISTDWIDEMTSRSALMYSMDATITGGGNNSSYLISLNHYDQDGLIAKSGMHRDALRGVIDTKVNDWLKVGLNMNLGYESYETNSAASEAGSLYYQNPFVFAHVYLPYDSPRYYTINDKGGIEYGEKAKYYHYSGVWDSNFLSDLTLGKRTNVTANVSLYEQLNPVKGLTLRAQQAGVGFDYRNTAMMEPQKSFVTPMGDLVNMSSWQKGYRSEAFQRYYQFTYTNTAEYRTTFNNVHELTLLAGQESILQSNNAFNVRTNGQPNPIQMMLTNGTEVAMSNVGQTLEKSVINSWFFNGSYNYDSRYFLDASFRRDGSSKFAPGHRWSSFWSVGAMWNMKKEVFLQDYTWLDDLKFRVNYGTTGNSGISNYSYFGTVAKGSIYNGQATLGISTPSNYDLKWETVESFDVGFNAGLFDRLTVTADYYLKNTKDMLMDIPYSYTTGFSSGTANIGSMRNQGVELDVNVDVIKTRDWYWGLHGNFNYNKNQITKLFNGKQSYELSNYGLYYEVGKDANQLYSVRYMGVDPRDGMQQWLDADGNLTKKFNAESMRVGLEKSFIAPWTGGFGTDVRWKNLSLRADFAWAADKWMFNWSRQVVRRATWGVSDQNQDKSMLNMWTKPGDVTDIQNLCDGYGNTSISTNGADDRDLENSSYVRLKNLTLQYSLPTSLLSPLKMQGVTFHFTGRNLLTFTGYTGVDPEYENNGVRFSYPNTRQYEFGVEVTF